MRPVGVSTSIIGSSQNRPREPVRTEHPLACASTEATASAPKASAAASRGTKTRVTISACASIWIDLARYPAARAGAPSSSAEGPIAHRPRQNTGSSVTAPSAVVSCQSTASGRP